MRKALEIALGIVTSIGGFLEAGSTATSAQAESSAYRSSGKAMGASKPASLRGGFG